MSNGKFSGPAILMQQLDIWGRRRLLLGFLNVSLDRNCRGCEANGIEYLVYIYIYK